MSDATEVMAWLHARGLDIEPTGLEAALGAALQSMPARYFAQPGQEGLTGAEVEVARAAGLDPEPARNGPDPMLQGVVAHAALLRSGLGTRAAAERLGVSDARIRQRLQEGTLLAIRERRTWKLPLFQFTAGGELPGWAEVCPALPAWASPVVVERWLSLPHPDLVVGEGETPTSPRDWLLAGRPPLAVAALAGELG